MMRCYIGMLFVVFVMLMGCASDSYQKPDYAFYHWKSEAIFSDSYKDAIATAETKTVYMHYFDVDNLNAPTYYDDGVYPTYVLKNVDPAYQNFDIVPVVYITNSVLQTDGLVVADLADKITGIVQQISEKHFSKTFTRIQIDCDWTESTKNAYFELVTILKNQFDVEVTIRLHQIKFKERTGIPPVAKGSLMLYNVGDLKDRNQNSILEAAVVHQYINKETSYPIPLSLGLPLFSQTVVSNTTNKVRLMQHTDREVLENDAHFRQTDAINFEVIRDTLYKGFYLSEGFNLKLEALQESEIVASYQHIKSSTLDINEIIFYHLDETALATINLKTLLEQL